MNLTQDQNLPECDVVSDMVMSVMGVDKLAYVRAVEVAATGVKEYMVHAADGTPLASFESADEAEFSIRKHNLTPAKIH